MSYVIALAEEKVYFFSEDGGQVLFIMTFDEVRELLKKIEDNKDRAYSIE